MATTDRTHHIGPHTDEASEAILGEAVASLGQLRGLNWFGDAAITVHPLASLQRQIQNRLPDAVADARDQDYSWAEIGDLLGLTRAAAWHHYGRPGRQGTTRRGLNPPYPQPRALPRQKRRLHCPRCDDDRQDPPVSSRLRLLMFWLVRRR